VRRSEKDNKGIHYYYYDNPPGIPRKSTQGGTCHCTDRPSSSSPTPAPQNGPTTSRSLPVIAAYGYCSDALGIAGGGSGGGRRRRRGC